MTIRERQAMQGEWVSIAPEIRPSALKNPDGGIKPFYLTRAFTYGADDRFELTILNLGDPYGNLPLAKLYIKGHMIWLGDHPIAAGAQKVNFIADEDYEVTPLLQGFADAINQIAGKAYAVWEVNRTQSIFKKPFAPFGLAEGQIFACDLVYLRNDLLFWGRDTSMAVVSTRKPADQPAGAARPESSHEFQPAIQGVHAPVFDPGVALDRRGRIRSQQESEHANAPSQHAAVERHFAEAL